MNECPMCNTHNPPQAVTCRTCKLSLPRSNASSIFHTGDRPKMAVFDLDKTLFDLSRRERAAKRQGLKPGSKKWFEVINQNQYILMDTPIKGTVKFVNQLSENGFTIAYLSGRPRAALAATKQSLQESGFPIDADEQDLVFLHSGRGSIPNITNHKKSVLTHLKNKFDVDFFFDDTPEFREAAKSLFIPGVYPSIAAYTEKEERPKKARKNPHTSAPNCGCGKDPCVTYGGGVTTNPAPKPRKKRAKNGSMRKEPMDKYLDRFMGDKKMNEEFPDRSQRFAVGLSYARKFYGDAAVDKKYPPRENPPSKIEDFTKQDIVWTGPSPEKGLSANLLKAIKKLRHQNREYFGFASKNALWYHTNFETISAGVFDDYEEKAKFFEDNKVIYGFHTHPVRYMESVLGANMWSRWSDVPSPNDYAYHFMEKAEHGIKAEIVSTQHGFFIIEAFRKKGAPKKLTQKLYEHDWKAIMTVWNKPFTDSQDYVLTPWQHASDTVKAINSKTKFIGFKVTFYDNPVMAVKWKPSDDGGFDGKMIRVNPRTKKGHTSVRANPANVSEAKKMYQQFHKKQPKSVKKKQIDFGDTWVGLGKAWSIGYRSGKETGDESQKYIHNFGVDEESGKKFAEPDLYYVKNKDGSQMMVIMGGDWYIDVDEAGEVSWIYI